MKEENREEVLTIIAYVLYCFKMHIPCNLGYIMVKRMVNLPTSFKRPLPYGILLTNLFKNLQIDLGPSKVSTLKSLILDSIIKELHLPFPLSSMVSSTNVKKHFKELLKVPSNENEETQNESSKKGIMNEYHTLVEGQKEHTRLLNAIVDHVKTAFPSPYSPSSSSSRTFGPRNYH
ncbi:hypothetical protein L1987_02007 [Smallanthus sonchifolius]|uniref:Uncharacterized protein n=1 Tax=Smallanthus sonchifolius TaxID=185202 RepID=A0ACB9K6S0_9ASTR|nr:hypothetical protein L1987_02007 [Smallanthus sonchifolius]